MTESSNETLLLAECARGSAQALQSVMERHARLVYSAAYRVLGNRAEAEDASQIVFLIFQRKVGQLSAATVLAGWLHRTTWFVAQALKDENARRKRREKEAAAMRANVAASDDQWPELRPLLDDALNALPEKSRLAVILHHLDGQTLRQVGQSLGCSEDAARKRIDWALDKMRQRLKKRGLALSVGLLSASISAHAAETVPSSLLSTLGSQPMLAALSANQQDVAREAMRAMWWNQMKVTVTSVVALVLAMVLAAALYGGEAGPRASGASAPQPESPANSSASTPKGTWSVRGTVTDEGSNPVEGAFVAVGYTGPGPQTMARAFPEPWRSLAGLAGPFFDHEPRGPSTLTDVKGQYLIEGVHGPIGGSVVAYHKDFAPTWVRIERQMLTNSEVIEFPAIIVRQACSISGKVIDDAGKAVARAWVAVQPALRKAKTHEGLVYERPLYEYQIGDVRITRCDENGEFYLRGLVAKPYAIAAWTDDCPPVSRNINATGSDGDQIVIALSPGKSLKVKTVLLPDRRPLPGCFIGIEGQQWIRTNARGECELAGVTDEDHVVIAGPPEESHYRSKTPRTDYTFEYAQQKTCRAGGEIVFEFLPAHTLRLKLVDAETKAPITQSQIRLKPKWNDENHKYGPLPELCAPDTTAADGIFSIQRVRQAEWTLGVLCNGYFGHTQQLLIPLDGLRDPVEIALRPAKSSLRGRVLEAHTGKPRAGVKVFAYEWLAEFGDGNRQEILTKDDGTYEFTRLLGGTQRLRLEFSCDKFVTQIVQVASESERRETDVQGWPEEKTTRVWFAKGASRPTELADVKLAMQSSVRGTVRDLQGRGMRNYAISVFHAGQPQNLKASVAGSTHTAIDGSFELTLPSGKYDLSYGHRDWQEQTTIELKPGQALQLDLKSDGSPAEGDF